ncbi:hypothetical protein N8T08_009260 [Aspergillus melleus]|uniref:Uncharacterized protein n=1 Tax=Aspergillus melleus TaxID=138277 RepID=A0ACC3AU06_9EURO|nr:hypothetical protein N8T08_009260 [Aspergillus melleus]
MGRQLQAGPISGVHIKATLIATDAGLSQPGAEGSWAVWPSSPVAVTPVRRYDSQMNPLDFIPGEIEGTEGMRLQPIEKRRIRE